MLRVVLTELKQALVGVSPDDGPNLGDVVKQYVEQLDEKYEGFPTPGELPGLVKGKISDFVDSVETKSVLALSNLFGRTRMLLAIVAWCMPLTQGASGGKAHRRGGRRRRGRRGRPNQRQVLENQLTRSFAAMNLGSRMKTLTRSYMYDIDIHFQPGIIESITISLVELLGASGTASVTDWFDEFRIKRLVLIATGTDTMDSIPSIASCPDTNDMKPTTFEELLRMRGTRVQPLNFFNGTMLLGAISPKWKLVGGGTNPDTPENVWVNNWLPTDNLGKAKDWYGIVLAMGGIKQGKTVTVNCVARCTVGFRGFQ